MDLLDLLVLLVLLVPLVLLVSVAYPDSQVVLQDPQVQLVPLDHRVLLVL